MPWRDECVMDQRIRFVLECKSKQKTMSRLCEEYGISRPTGYLWLRRYEETGSVTGLKEMSRRPHHYRNKTADELEELVIEIRKAKGWGAKKISEILGKRGHKVPVSTTHRILSRRGMIEAVEVQAKAIKRFERSECNQMMQMDFKGEYRVKEGKSYPLSYIDDHSRYAIGLWPLPNTKAMGVFEMLRNCFREVGVPESILMDHGPPWYSTQSRHGLTRLSVWLIKQGVKLMFSGIRHPQTHGKVERFHRTLKERTRHRGEPLTLEEWQEWALEFTREYNEERPHEALQMKTPAEVYTRNNLRPYQESPPEWEYTGGKVMRLGVDGDLYYRGGSYFVCEALAGEQVRMDVVDEKLLVRFRRTIVREIDLRTGASIPVVIELS